MTLTLSARPIVGQLRATMKLTPEDGKFILSQSWDIYHLGGQLYDTYLLLIFYKSIESNLDNLTQKGKLRTLS